MNRLIRQIAVIARRDFLAMVATPTFLLFLLAPLFMIGFGAVGGSGAAQLGASSAEKTRVAAIVGGADAARLQAADRTLRALYRGEEGPPVLLIIEPLGDANAQTKSVFARKDLDVTAVLAGSLSAPKIKYNMPSRRHAEYLAMLADDVVREGRTGLALDKRIITPAITENPSTKSGSVRGQQAAGFGAVFVIFFLTLLLAGQAVGTLAEEKSNKVIEILAASVPLEAVFLGKLIGMFGVAVLFVGFWGTLVMLGVSVVPQAAPVLTGLAPAIGVPAFFILGALYFTMAYMLLGAVFLGVGAQAATIREIQMLSLPITVFQVSMFGLSAAAASNPGSSIARIAEIFPFSSPFAMAARGATDPAIWPHIVALGWQALWVAITIWIAVRLFRIGVLKSGSGWRGLFRRKRAAA
jgi:ABC-2 type transport system permease protein